MKILGLSCFYHDSAAALIVDGRIAFAAAEERYSRVKHDNRFPALAIAEALKFSGLSIHDLDAIVFYEKPLRKFERILSIFAQTFPFTLTQFTAHMPEWLSQKIDMEGLVRSRYGYKGSFCYVPHHRSHAAAAYLTSPFDSAAVVTIDGVGEYDTTCIWHGKEGALTRLATLQYPHSLGLLYSTITAYLGFRVNDEEYKVMALAAYGDASKAKALERIVTCESDGSFFLNEEYFAFSYGERMWSERLEALLGPARKPDEPLEERHKDIAASLQRLSERMILAVLNEAARLTGETRLCLSGGVALNAVANGLILGETPYADMHIWGAAGDDGAAAGAALDAYYRLSRASRVAAEPLALLLGTDVISGDAQPEGVTVMHLDAQAVPERIAALLSDGDVVARVAGRMEFGPRALGNRSLLAHPSHPKSVAALSAIKAREPYRPFGGIFLENSLSEFCDIPKSVTSYPYMNVCLHAKAAMREKISSIVHVDGTCRAQTIADAEGQKEVRAILEAFKARTGLGCLLNTSFNRRGEPLVENAEQAIDVFLTSPIDHLLVGTSLYSKRR